MVNYKQNFYTILGISETATSEEIKRSFFKKVKEIGGPEKNPKDYKVIREAYDTLYNPTSRNEYDAMSSFGEEINLLVEQAEDEWSKDDPNFELIVKCLKKAVVLGPQIGRIRNLLGLALNSIENHTDAIKQFEKAIDIHPDNSDYWLNLGYAYKSGKNYDRAKESFQKALRLDKESPSSYIAIAYLYLELKDFAKAHLALDTGIHADGKVDFSDFSLYYHKIQLFFLENKIDQAEVLFRKVESIANEEADKKYAAWMFVELSHMLYEFKRYDLIEKLTQSALRLDPTNEHYRELYQSSKRTLRLFKQFEELSKDDTIHELVKEFVAAYLANLAGYLEEDEYDDRIKQDADYLYLALDTAPDNKLIKMSVLKLYTDYPQLYNLNKHAFDRIMKYSAITTKFRSKCPSCSKNVVVDFYQNGQYSCPHCNRGFQYSNGHYSTVSESSCFIATAVYGDPSHPNVMTFRKWRDTHLKNNIIGSIFIFTYYKVGPYLAGTICKSPRVLKLMRKFLDSVSQRLTR